MAYIIVERAEASLIDRLWPYRVVIDGKTRGFVRSKEKWSFEVPAGTHTVSFVVGIHQTPPVKVAVAICTRVVCHSTLALAFGAYSAFSTDSLTVIEEDTADNVETPHPNAVLTDPNTEAGRRWLGIKPPKRRDIPGSLRLSSPKMGAAMTARRLLELELQSAVANRRLEIGYQPQISLAGNGICGFEALVHWPHPVHGKIPAGDFVHLAEDLGLLSAIGQNVIEAACLEASSWSDTISVSVNVRSAQLRDEAFPRIVAAALAAAHLAPHRLILEISVPRVAGPNDDEVVGILHALRKIGVRIAADNVGATDDIPAEFITSLFDRVKIDRSLVSKIGLSHERKKKVRDLVTLCAARKVPLCAVGVETKDDLEILRTMGCMEAQGHLFAQALAARDVATMIARWNTASNDRRPVAAKLPFEALLNIVEEMMLVAAFDAASGTVTVSYANDAFCRATDYNPGELVGQPLDTFLTASGVAAEAVERVSQGGRYARAPVMVRGKRGQAILFSACAVPGAAADGPAYYAFVAPQVIERAAVA